MLTPFVKNSKNKNNVVSNIAIRNSNAVSPLQLIDIRPEALLQRKIQDLANKNISDFKNNQTARENTTVQRKVLVSGKPATMLSKGSAFVNGESVELGDRGAEWVTDGYARSYLSNQEFKSHLQGAPVDVGLAKKLGRWYRLPFFSAKQFFVLGENHGAFGYRELIKESNQPGKVLGEGGANALLSATPDNALQANPKGLKDKDGASRESMMENVTAKAYFGLTILRGNCVKLKKGVDDVEGPIKLPEKEWLENYQKVAPEKRKVGSSLDKVPFYENEEGKNVYATFGTNAENYNPVNTAFKVVEDLDNAIQAYKGIVSQGMLDIRAAILIATGIKNVNPVDYDALIAQIDILYPLVQSLAFAEATELNGGNDPTTGLKKRLDVVDVNLSKYNPRQKRSFAHRDYVMYKSVLKARADHIMAGMGGNHAKNLKDALTEEGVQVVLFNEYVGSEYSSDAIAPLGETDGYAEKLEEAESDKEVFAISREKKGFGTLLETVDLMMEKKNIGAGNLYKSILEILPKKDWSERMIEVDKVIDQIDEYNKMDQESVGAGNLFIEFNSVLKKYDHHLPVLV